jgi:hypothetical protein
MNFTVISRRKKVICLYSFTGSGNSTFLFGSRRVGNGVSPTLA